MNTTARIKKTGKNFEILVDMEKALAFKRGGGENDFLEIDRVFSDAKRGEKASEEDMKKAFGTEDINEIAEKIVKEGEVLTTQDYRDEQQEKKFNQVIDFLTKNVIDPQTGNPHTPERIKSALEQAHVNIKNVPIEEQIKDIIEKIEKIIPIRFETKKVKISVPAVQTGKVYGLVNPYKEEEKWMNDGSLEVVVNIPAGLVMDFYDKLNSITHGSAVTEEMKNE